MIHIITKKPRDKRETSIRAEGGTAYTWGGPFPQPEDRRFRVHGGRGI